MVLKLYGSLSSTCTRRVATVLYEKQVPFELISIDFANGEHKSAKFLEKQPFGQIPYIDDDGFILYESRAIAWYIAVKYADQGNRLIPKDVRDQALMHQAWSVETAHFDHAEKVIFEVVFKKYRGLDADPVALQKHLDALDQTLDVYDKILSKQKYIAGNEVTLVDIFHLPYASMLPLTGKDIIATKPNVKRWYDDVSSRASWQAVKDGVKSTAAY